MRLGQQSGRTGGNEEGTKGVRAFCGSCCSLAAIAVSMALATPFRSASDVSWPKPTGQASAWKPMEEKQAIVGDLICTTTPSELLRK